MYFLQDRKAFETTFGPLVELHVTVKLFSKTHVTETPLNDKAAF